MKKSCCIILALFLLIMVPVRGYAASAPLVFGIGEEIILPFLLSLLGVQAKESIDSYDDLASYNDEIETELTSLAGSEAVMYFVQRAVQGLIDTDSIVWQKLKELAIENYVIADSSVGSVAPSFDAIGNFNYYPTESINISYNNGWGSTMSGLERATAFVLSLSSNSTGVVIGASSTNTNLMYSHTYDGRTVYWSYFGGSSSIWRLVTTPSAFEVSQSEYNEFNDNRAMVAWSMIYEGSVASENIASYSDAFSNVLTSEDKESLVDGSNVIQLYNPSTYQNGLNMIEGGDGEDDPNLKKIPAILTADWWNFLQQFGQGENDNQYVNAYNALNAIDGGSVGNVSDAYDSLGLASVISDAVNAALGKMSLEDLNIYPDSLSVAQTIDDSIPPSLTPEAPNEGINNESEQGLYKLPDLRDYFPFCIPFDLVDLLSCFVAEPETPSFVIALSDGDNMVEGQMDLHIWDNIASVIRTFELIGFTVGLILITRNIIRG